MNKEERHPRGFFIGIGIAIGIPLGIPFGIAIGNIAIGPALGLPIGVAIGLIMEQKFNKEQSEMSDAEKVHQKKWLTWSVFGGLFLLVIFLSIYLFIK